VVHTPVVLGSGIGPAERIGRNRPTLYHSVSMQHHTRRPGVPRPLPDLFRALGAAVSGDIPDVTVSGIVADSRQVEPGDLFVATVGGVVDGHDYVEDAASRGAVAAVVQREPEGGWPIPAVRVESGRRALAELAADWYGHPARGLPLVGITGTMGKTSTLSFLESMLRAAGRREGSIGSLGIRRGGSSLGATGFTVPGPIRLHEGLRDLRDAGCDVVLMEATTHAMTQERLHGVGFDLGVFTGIVPLEHMEYHASFAEYAEAKLRFFRRLRPGAPLVFFADCPVLAGVVPERDVVPVGCGTGEDAALRLWIDRVDADGTTVRMVAERGVARVDGSVSEPFEIRGRLRLVGRSAAVNTLLAAGAAAALGAPPHAIESALEQAEPAPRRMQVVQTEPFTILDDFGGHPDTVTAVFEVIRALRWRRLHVLSGFRANRGERINRAMAEALGTWLRQTGCETLCLTAAEETADERNRVSPGEQQVFEAALRGRDVPFVSEARLDSALAHVLPRVQPGDLLVILGTQGLDGAAARVVEATGAG